MKTADLWFHSMVMLSHLALDQRIFCKNLSERFDLSGPLPKAARQHTLGSPLEVM